ncbi:flavodoxin [Treponema vincentii ATCC 35580]|uniref:Flavodoxin n=1 Tax=Treponema vincentii ATCC 35580 TaxID=596324 RepID=C8PPX5_9SPIR|nr:flavodoxin [Treponema vincentii]EEV20575.1 flavodoxin [Treponema vincentii ATCC 35580]
MKFTQKMMAVFAVAAVFLAMGVPACAVPGSPANTTVNAKKVLVVYYSATGTTERLAKIIAQETKADTFVIRPKQPYTSADLNWNNKNSRVVQEHEMGVDKVSVTLESTTVPNFESYDTVFIGYPIWWREASWVVDEFVKNNNFTGKSVVTFCTSISTGTGESRKRLEKLAKTGNWVTGERFPSSFSEVSVKAWLKGLGF